MQNKYISSARSPRRALARTLGYQLWQRRQELDLIADKVCHQTGIKRYELDMIELGKGNVSIGAWLLRLEFYNRNIDFGKLRQVE